MRKVWLSVVVLAGCDGEVIPDRDDTDERDNGCADLTTLDVDLTVEGQVVDGADAPLQGAEVLLVDIASLPEKKWGTDTTGADGRFRIQATDVEWFPGASLCFTDYTVRASAGADRAETDVNFQIYQAIDDGSYTITLSRALRLEVE